MQLLGPSLCVSVLSIVRDSGFSIVVLLMELQLFAKGTWNIGCPVIVGEILWFKGRDVATSLKYSNPRGLRNITEED